MKQQFLLKQTFVSVFILFSIGLKCQTFTDTGISFPDSQSPQLEFIDIDNDGDLDIIRACDMSSANCFRNDGNGQFTPLWWISTSWRKGSFSSGDYDNDGFIDLAFSSTGNGQNTAIYRNNGNFTFSEQTDIVIDGAIGSTKFADYDNDGLLDILVTGSFISKIYHNNGKNSFTEKTEIKLIPVNHAAAAWGDYDNDGFLDLVITGLNKLNIRSAELYHNDKNGNFTRIVGSEFLPVEDGSLEWGDYNNDGWLDLLMTGYDGSFPYKTIIYKNNGDGTFTRQTSIMLQGVRYGSARFGDFDNDGSLDILLTGSKSDPWGQVTKVYRNNNDNSFTELTDVVLPQVEAGNAVWGDYNNDKRLDILVAGSNSSGNVTKIFKNNVALQNTEPPAPAEFSSVVNGTKIVLSWSEVQTDNTPARAMTYNVSVGSETGKTDILSPNSSQDGLRRMAGPGNAQLGTDYYLDGLRWNTKYFAKVQAVDNGFLGGAFSGEIQFSQAPVQSSVLKGCILNSTSLALTWARGNGDYSMVFAHEGTAGQSSPVNFTTYYANSRFGDGSPVGSSGWYCVYKGNGDSVAVTGLLQTRSYVFHVLEVQGLSGNEVYCPLSSTNTGSFSTSLFTEQPAITFSNIESYSQAIGDYDNDGYSDVIISGYPVTGPPLTRLFRNNGQGDFIEQTDKVFPGYTSSIAWGDYDNDGDPDLVLCGQVFSKIYINDGNSFSEAASTDLTPVYEGSVNWADYDNDGDLDLLITGISEESQEGPKGSSKVYRNDDGIFVDINAGIPGIFQGSSCWIDYNNDGLVDIIISGMTDFYSGKTCTKLFRNNGDDHFTEELNVSLPGVCQGSVLAGDYNRDGLQDILLAGGLGNLQYTGITRVYKNKEDGTFEYQENLHLPGISSGTAAWCDYDNDGYSDIIIDGYIEYVPVSKIYHNNGDETFTDMGDLDFPGSRRIGFCDFDNDGDIDIVSKPNLSFTRIFRNNFITDCGAIQPNKKPDAVTHLRSQNKPEGVLLSWSPVTSDVTSGKTMSYNVRIGTAPGKTDIVSPNSLDNGYRMIIDYGNSQLDTIFLIKKLLPGTYYWSVQAIDQNFAGGSWSDCQSFEVKNVQAFFSADEVCHGSPTHFTSDQSVATKGIASWFWEFGDGATSILQNPQHTYASSGTFSVKLKITDIEDATDFVINSITVKPKPSVNFNAPVICQGISTSFTNSTNSNGLTISSWFWDFDDGQTSILQTPPAHGYLGAADYTVILRAQADNGCIDEISKTVVVARNPIAAISADGATTFCSGQSVTLSTISDAQYTYAWKRDGAAVTGAISNSYTASVSGSYVVAVTNTLGNCLTISSAVSVTVNTSPAAPLIRPSGPVTFCQGESIDLSVTYTDGYEYQWKLNGGAIGSGSTYTAITPGTYSLEVANALGCKTNATNTVEVTVNSKPALPTVSISGPTIFCQGSSVELSVTNTGGCSYQWENNTAAITGATTNSFIAGSSGAYTLRITNASNCEARTENVNVNVLDTPSAPSIINYGPITFCQGDSVLLGVNPVSGNSYDWKLNGGSLGIDRNSLSAKSSGDYTLKVSNSSGCSATSVNAIPVAVNPNPSPRTISTSGVTTFCEGSNVTLSVSPEAGCSYAWRNETGPISGAVTNSYAANSTGSYKTDISNADGCTITTNPVIVLVKQSPSPPSIAYSGETTFCDGDSVILNVNNTSGYSFSWKRDGGNIGSNKSSLTATMTGEYSLAVANSAGCTANAVNTINVRVNPKPSARTISTSGVTTFCQGSSVTLSVLPEDGCSYTWKNGTSLVTGALSNSFVASSTGSYRLDISSTNGCTLTTLPVSVLVKQSPSKPILDNSNYTKGKCPGENPVRLSTTLVSGYKYQWSKNEQLHAFDTLPYIEFFEAGNYKLTAELNGCYSESDLFSADFPAGLQKPVIYAEGPTYWYLACSNTDAAAYKWYWNGKLVENATKYYFVANQKLGVYQVSVGDKNGCFTKSDPVSVPPDYTTAIDDPDPFADLKIYPNPTPGLFTIEMNNNIFGELSIDIFNQPGSKVLNIKFDKTTEHFKSQIDLSGQAKGMYMINFFLGKYFATRKVMVE